MLSKHLTFKSKVWSRPELCTIFSFRNWLETGSNFSSYIVDMPLCILEYSVTRPSNPDPLLYIYISRKILLVPRKEKWFHCYVGGLQNLRGKNKVIIFTIIVILIIIRIIGTYIISVLKNDYKNLWSYSYTSLISLYNTTKLRKHVSLINIFPWHYN